MILQGVTDLNTIKEALTDRIKCSTQMLYDITKNIRENSFTQERTWMHPFPDFYKSEENYEPADCHTEVFGKTFRNNLGCEIKKKAEEL